MFFKCDDYNPLKTVFSRGLQIICKIFLPGPDLPPQHPHQYHQPNHQKSGDSKDSANQKGRHVYSAEAGIPLVQQHKIHQINENQPEASPNHEINQPFPLHTHPSPLPLFLFRHLLRSFSGSFFSCLLRFPFPGLNSRTGFRFLLQYLILFSLRICIDFLF